MWILRFTYALPGYVLLLAAFGKAVNIRKFAIAVKDYKLLPQGWNLLAAWLIVTTEVLGGLGVIFGQLMPWSAYFTAFLLILFGSAMATNLIRGRLDLDCGCTSGVAKMRISWRAVIRNCALAGLAVLYAWDGSVSVSMASVISGLLFLVFIASIVQDFREGHPDTRELSAALYSLNGANDGEV